MREWLASQLSSRIHIYFVSILRTPLNLSRTYFYVRQALPQALGRHDDCAIRYYNTFDMISCLVLRTSCFYNLGIMTCSRIPPSGSSARLSKPRSGRGGTLTWRDESAQQIAMHALTFRKGASLSVFELIFRRVSVECAEDPPNTTLLCNTDWSAFNCQS